MEEQMTLAQWVTYLSERQLPLLKQSRLDLQQVGSYESISIAKFSNIALTDPGLTLNILHAASVLPRSRLQDEIHTVDAAAMKLGARQLTQTISNIDILDDCLDSTDKTTYMQIVSRAYHAAYQAYGMARERVDMAPEELFTAAMLHEIGSLMLLVHGEGITINLALLDNIESQKKQFGFSLDQLSYALAKTWKLSSFILKSLEENDEAHTNPRLYEIHLAGKLAQYADQGWETETMEALIEMVATHLHCDPETAMLEIRDNAIQCAEETLFYGITPAAASLPDLDDDLRKRISCGSTSSQQEDAPGKTRLVAASLAPENPYSPLNPVIFDQTIKAIKSHLTGKFILAEFMTMMKRGFQNGLKFNRAFFAMREQNGDHLVSRFMFGNDTGLRDLRIPVTSRNLFQRLLENPQAIYCKADNQEKIIPLLPKAFHDLIKTNDFFVTTVRSKGKAIGIVYADRYGNNYGLDDNDYEKFRQLCQLLEKGFERMGK